LILAGAGWITNRKQTILLEAANRLAQNYPRQGPWNVDLRTPPGPEGSNGSLLRICRGHPDTLFNDEARMMNDESKLVRALSRIFISSFILLPSSFALA
jgi:hypothetical protein